MAVRLRGEALVAGAAEGELLHLAAPLSFWGGVDPARGTITQPRHPNHRACISDKVLALSRTIGSSSGSAVLLELVHCGRAPRAILLGEPDAILILGALVAREMGYRTIPVLRCRTDALPTAGWARVGGDGVVEIE